MRSDYGLYGVAIICFIIAAAFGASLVPGYTPAEAAGVTVTAVFVLLGIISGGVGYSARPKAMMPPPRPAPMETRASEMLSIPPVAEVSQPSPALAEPVQPVEQVTPPEIAVVTVSEPSPLPTVTTPEPAPMPPTEPVAMEEKPKEKTVRRRRRKAAATENTE